MQKSNTMDFQKTCETVTSAFKDTCDLRQIDLSVGNIQCKFVYIDGYINTLLFEDNILKPLKNIAQTDSVTLDLLNEYTMMTTPIQEIDDIQKAISLVASGEILFICDNSEVMFVYSEKKYSARAITEPPVSTVLRGPREGFVEDLKTNMFLIRRRLATPDLKFELLSAGKYTQTKIALCFIDGIADKKIVNKIKKQIDSIDIDGIIESSYIARFLEENKLSLFSQVGSSEKPDIIVGKMLEGRVAIIVDGSPSVLTLPFLIYENFQMSEDYYIKSYRASMLRFIRMFAFCFSILLPSLYVALQEHQYQLFPLKFLLSSLGSIYAIPLSATLEMLLIMAIFEILNETSVRMPRYVSMALSVVGAIVLGEAAVSAGLFSISSVIIVAVSTVGIYCVPDEINSSNILRFVFVGIAGVLGLVGVILCVVALIAYMCSINSYGTAFMSPYAPAIVHDWQDGIFKAQIEEFEERPFSLPTSNRTRQRPAHKKNKKDKT